MAIISQNDLLQYLYKESSAETALHISQALETDASLRERLQVLSAANEKLDKIPLLSPGEGSLDKIMQYAENGVKAFS